MSVKEYSLAGLRTQLRKDPYFLRVYSMLINGDNLERGDAMFILRTAIDFMRMRNNDCIYLGYSIVLRYSLATGDYQPLRDIALANNYMPIVNLLEKQETNQQALEDLNATLILALRQAFVDDEKGIVKSAGQLKLDSFSRKNENFAIVAPTSYGKSELIIDKAKHFYEKGMKVCVLVPTKALVAQTKRSLRKVGIKDVVSHPDMYLEQKFNDAGMVSVLTQERLLGLFTLHPDFKLDYLYVDEAHKILEGDNRSLAISQCILIARKRNDFTIVNFFTPFLINTSNITLIDEKEPKDYRVTERLKVERYRYLDWNANKQYVYDQFLDYPIYSKEISVDSPALFVYKEASNKNIAYLNTPKQVVRFANALCEINTDFTPSKELEEWIQAIIDYTDKDYDLVECLKHGIIYHHGGIPDIIKMYLENIYTADKNGAKFLVTTSTLLEGVNIPADKLFILNSGLGGEALSSSDLRNLSGRISRFKEVFSEEFGSPMLLEPAIYLMNHKDFERGTLKNPFNFLSKNVKLGANMDEDVKNPLLSNVKVSELYRRNKEIDFLNNLENGYVPEEQSRPLAESAIAKLCFKHNIRDFDILDNESVLNLNLASFLEQNTDLPLLDSEQVIDAVYKIFLSDINLNKIRKNKEVPITTIKNSAGARRFYSMFFDWSVTYKSFKYMVNKMMKYWETRDDDHLEYVGYLGEFDAFGGKNPQNGLHYVYIKQKSRAEKINMAITRVKLSQDFADTHLNKYVEILNEMGLVSQEYFNLLRYHTNDETIILLRKQGLTFDLAKTLVNNYSEFIATDEVGLIVFNSIDELIVRMRDDKVNDILLFEAENFL